MDIKEITNEDVKKQYAREILENLPNWFGIPEAVEEYVMESSKMPFYAAFDEKKVIGFLALKQHNSFSAEIYVMGINEHYHRQGLGRLFVEKCLAWCKQEKIEFLQVKTLDESNPDPFYAKTRQFYRAMGFKPLECFPTLWDESNPCLLMIMSIDSYI
ncbi:GNAT family N-acetyltransferase [Bacillaceae bacterium Marseille-Q3522]|nr:GNAT family N-acetyltransferase [Bacillaceae bacterium Marseille-Q3522]